MQLKTKKGRLTAYGFSCGYTETRDRQGLANDGRRWNDEAYVRIEARGMGYLVRASGRYMRREVYLGPSLSAARQALDTFNIEAAHEADKEAYFASVGA